MVGFIFRSWSRSLRLRSPIAIERVGGRLAPAILVPGGSDSRPSGLASRQVGAVVNGETETDQQFVVAYL